MNGKYALIGLNKPWKAGGFPALYATVDLPNEDWFHATIDMPKDRTDALWKWMTDGEESFKGKMCIVEHDGTYADGIPKNPKVIEIYEVPIKEWNNYFDWSKMKKYKNI